MQKNYSDESQLYYWLLSYFVFFILKHSESSELKCVCLKMNLVVIRFL